MNLLNVENQKTVSENDSKTIDNAIEKTVLEEQFLTLSGELKNEILIVLKKVENTHNHTVSINRKHVDDMAKKSEFESLSNDFGRYFKSLEDELITKSNQLNRWRLVASAGLVLSVITSFLMLLYALRADGFVYF